MKPREDDRPAAAGDLELRDRELFNRIADHYAAKDLLPAHSLARRCRLQQTLAALPLNPGMAILEVGCGAGFAARYLKGRFMTYVGIDHSSQLIDLARHFNSGEGVSFQAAGIDDFETQQRFDLCLLIGVIHHLEGTAEKLNHMVKLLKPGAWMVANEPQPANPLIRMARSLRKRVDKRYSDDQLELSRDQLLQLFRHAGLEDVCVRPQGLFSTPFAEVVMPFQPLTRPLSAAACAMDRFLEQRCGERLGRLTWNLVAAGRKPA